MSSADTKAVVVASVYAGAYGPEQIGGLLIQTRERL